MDRNSIESKTSVMLILVNRASGAEINVVGRVTITHGVTPTGSEYGPPYKNVSRAHLLAIREADQPVRVGESHRIRLRHDDLPETTVT